jgi:hypothetical protein
MDMHDVTGFSVSVCTTDGQNNLGGTGTAEFYFWDGYMPDAGHVSSLSKNVDATGPCWVSGDFVTANPRGRMWVGTKGVTTTDAGTVIVRVIATLGSK